MAASRSRAPPGAGSRPRQPASSSAATAPRCCRAFRIMEACNIVRRLPGDKTTRYGSRRDVPRRAEARSHDGVPRSRLLGRGAESRTTGRARRRGRRRRRARLFAARRGARRGDRFRTSRAHARSPDRQHRPAGGVARRVRVRERRQQRRLARPLLHEQPVRVPQRALSQPGRRDVRRCRAERGCGGPEPPGRGRVDGRRVGRLRQRWARGPAGLQMGLPPALPQSRRAALRGRDRRRGAAPVDEQQWSGVVRLRPRRAARSLCHRLFPLWHLKTTRIMHNSFEFATNGGKNRLFHNLGNGRFEDVTDQMGVGSTRWTLAVAAGDFNGDGWPDLFLANDYGPEELFVNDSGKRFVLTRAGLESDSKSGMSATLGDVLNRGRLDAFVTNISERAYLFQGNNLRLNFLPELGRFEQGAEGAVADAGWAWGAQLGDLDNDGRNELFIVNGYVSGDRDRSYWYAMSKVAGANGNVFEDARNWPVIGSASLSGYERSRVLVGRGLSGWTDVAATVGVTDEYDGRAVALVDLFNRGVLDVVVANQNQRALIYKNTVAPGNHWVAFKLVGTRSNRSAIGAEVTLEAGGARQLKIVDGGMGFASQNDRRLHFGLGSAARVDRVVIRWPSGARQVVEHPALDRLNVITEPGAVP